MSELIRKQHNVSVLLYRIVCRAKYGKAIFTRDVDEKLKEICEDIALRYEIEFLEIGADRGRVHFFVQSVPMYSPKQLVQIIKSLTAREIFKSCPEVKKHLWGGKFWTDGYFVSTVGAHANEEMIKNCVQQQGKVEDKGQLRLF